MILNPYSAQEKQVLDYQFKPIDPRPRISAPEREHIFRSQHYSPFEEVDEFGNFRHGAVPYTPSPVVNTEGVVSIPINFGAAPMSQIEAAQLAQAAVDRLAPTGFEQDNL